MSFGPLERVEDRGKLLLEIVLLSLDNVVIHSDSDHGTAFLSRSYAEWIELRRQLGYQELTN
jgi:hypothetical protein